MKRVNLLIASFCSLLVLLLSSCSGSTNNKGGEEISFNVSGYYDGELVVIKNPKSTDDKVEYNPINTTILIREVANGEYEFLIPNFEWENQEARNISFNVQIEKDDKRKEGTLDGYIPANRNDIIPDTEMTLMGQIRESDISVNANFTPSNKSNPEYVVTFKGAKSSKTFVSYKFSFEEWIAVASDKSTHKHQIPEYESGMSWNSTDFEVGILRDMRRADKFTVVPSTTAFEGKKSASIQTIKTFDSQEYQKLPFVYAGYLYTGYYDTTKSGLDAAQVGVPFDKEPLSIKGYYMYTLGKEYYRCLDVLKPSEVELTEDLKDEFMIGMYLYKVSSNQEYLSLKEVFTSDKVVGEAVFAANNESKNFDSFDAKFTFKEGESFNPQDKYKLAIVITSSKNGHNYSGAIDSKLLVDKLEISTKE